jgi:hypothetical protein
MTFNPRIGYIEFRVYLKADASKIEVEHAADNLQDMLVDIVSYEDAPPVFTQDVTYEIKVEPLSLDDGRTLA